jgi:hypothetical protein
MDLFVGARAADRARVRLTTFGRPGTIAFRHAICAWKRHANRETHEFGAPHTHAGVPRDTYSATQHNPIGNAEAHADTDAHINANAHTHTEADPDTYADTGSNANADSGAANVQPCVRDRDGERGVDQPDR